MQSARPQGLHRPVQFLHRPVLAGCAPNRALSVPGPDVPVQRYAPGRLVALVPAHQSIQGRPGLLHFPSHVAPTVAPLKFVYWRAWLRCGCGVQVCPKRNQHHGADGHCGVDDRGENPCSCRAVPDGAHQIPQRQETHGECTYTDGCNSADRPAVYPARCSRPDGEGDAMHGGEQGDGRHCGGTDLDDDVWDVRQHGMLVWASLHARSA
jgi:hypothetical protein